LIAEYIAGQTELILITGSNGFIGSRVVAALLDRGFVNLRCLVRPSSNLTALHKSMSAHDKAAVRIFEGNLLSREDCERIMEGVSVVYHVAGGRGEKSYPDAYLNSVVTTRNLLDAVIKNKAVKRFVNISSFSVYSNENIRRGGLLDETCDVESRPQLRGDAYSYAKAGQDEVVREYAETYSVPCVIVRPGVVYGPGNKGIHGRVGIGTFGIFIHLGGSNRIPLSYVDNCAEAIMLAGLRKGVEGEVFNVVDDDLPTSRKFLKMYKKNVRDFKSFPVPYRVFYLFCYLWEKYSQWSQGQLPPVFNRMMCATYWKGNRYSNAKLKNLLGWKQKISFKDAAERYFEYQRSISGDK
jgi:nucleoside-diphosphate-sugar epimerase